MKKAIVVTLFITSLALSFVAGSLYRAHTSLEMDDITDWSVVDNELTLYTDDGDAYVWYK